MKISVKDRYIFGFGLVFIVIIIFFSIKYCPKVIHYECFDRIPIYFSDTSLLYKMFKPEIFYYRSREFGYLLDILEVHTLVFFKHLGKLTFISPFHYLGIFIIAVMQLVFSRRMLKHVSSINSVLLTMLFLTTTAAVLSGGTHFRTAKIVDAIFIYLMAWLLLTVGKKKHDKSYAVYSSFLAGAIGLVLAFTDDMGAAYVFIALTACILLKWKNKLDCFRPHIIALTVALTAYAAYKYLLGVHIAVAILGTDGFRIMPLIDNSASPLNIWYGGLLLGDYAGLFYGNFIKPAKAVVLIILFLPVLILAVGRKSAVAQKAVRKLKMFLGEDAAGAASLAVFYLIVILNIGSVIAHPAILWPEVKIAYYSLPETVLILLFSSLFFDKLLKQLPALKIMDEKRGNFLLTAALILFISCNVASLPGHKANMLNGHLSFYYAAHAEMTRSIKEDNYISPYLGPEGKKFCEFYKRL